MDRIFEKIVVDYPPEDLCTYPEYKGKPYFSIQYEENGEHFVGFGTYKPEVFSHYLNEYFIKNQNIFQLSGKPTSEDYIGRKELVEWLKNIQPKDGKELGVLFDIMEHVKNMQGVMPEQKKCKNCKWWSGDDDDSGFGYCQACKHGHYSDSWDIGIYRKTKADFYCADYVERQKEDKNDGHKDEC